MSREDYKVEVLSSSFEKMRGSDKLRYSAFGDMNSIGNDLVPNKGDKYELDVIGFVDFAVHNDHAEGEKDYNTLVLILEDGECVTTSSNPFRESFMNIYDCLSADFKEDGIENPVYRILASRRVTKDNKGTYMTCSVR